MACLYVPKSNKAGSPVHFGNPTVFASSSAFTTCFGGADPAKITTNPSKSHAQIPVRASKTRRFLPHPHGWFGFVETELRISDSKKIVKRNPKSF